MACVVSSGCPCPRSKLAELVVICCEGVVRTCFFICRRYHLSRPLDLPSAWAISYSIIMRTTAAFCAGELRQITTEPHCNQTQCDITPQGTGTNHPLGQE